MGRADISPGELQALRDQVDALMGGADISHEELQALQDRIETLRQTWRATHPGKQIAAPGVAIPYGLVRSTEAPVHATDAGDTIASLLADPENRFPPLSTTNRSNWDPSPSYQRSDGAYVKTYATDGADGLLVTTVVDGEERTIHFQAEHWVPDDFGFGTFELHDEEGNWRETYRAFDGFRYFEGHRVRVGEGWGHHITLGARTETVHLPDGEAAYEGRMRTYAYAADGDGTSARRDDLNGYFELEADFTTGRLDGRIDRLRLRERDENGNRLSWQNLPDTTYFAVEDGRIVDGQLVASLTGMDSTPDAAPNRTVRGYEGGILGEFYGPRAEEVGGVLNAESELHGRVMSGWFGGHQAIVDPRIPPGASAPLDAALDWQLDTEAVTHMETALVTMVEGDGAGGAHLSYRLDGADHTVHLAESDYGASPSFPTLYFKPAGNQGFFLWTYDRSSFIDVPEYEHFNINSFVVTTDAEEGGSLARLVRTPVVYGTPTTELPAGSAEYSGRIYAEGTPTTLSTTPGSSVRPRLRSSDLTLNADFTGGTLGGTVEDVEVRPAGASSYADAAGRFTIDGTIAESASGPTLTADLTGSEDLASYDLDMEGRFFGPGAAEVGGVVRGSNSADDTVVSGYFGGTKQ